MTEKGYDMPADLLLIGSIPHDTVVDVFEKFGRPLAAHLAALPDGEVGPRQHWISRVHYQVLSGHPELETVRRPMPENGVERLNPRDANDSWQFKVKTGIGKVRFGNPGWRLGFARDAINSYFVFKTLQDKGQLPRHLRFQVSVPSVNSTLPPRIFPDQSDLEKIRPGYQDALGAEIAKIVEKIPNEDLAIQWDCATEVQDAYGSISGLSKTTAIQRNIGQIEAISPRIPEKIALGYHLCFGTLGGWPRFAPLDLSGAVELGNAFIKASGRRVDWLHIPVLPDADESFFAPLQQLQPHGARVFLGMIHHMDTFAERVAMARKYIPDFGLAAYCGFGRVSPFELPTILNEHMKAMSTAA
jgi:catechol 2,3-dioxygenase-like lactoylglutathione lyase family enzyme